MGVSLCLDGGKGETVATWAGQVELGTIELTKVAPNSEALQRELAFNPIFLTDGIQLSDDPLLLVRSSVYAISVARRHQI